MVLRSKFAFPFVAFRRTAQRWAASCRSCVNDPGPHTKCKYLHVRAAVSEGEYSLFQVMAPIPWRRLACYTRDTLSCHQQIFFSLFFHESSVQVVGIIRAFE